MEDGTRNEVGPREAVAPEELSTPQLISRVAEQTSALVRDEMALAKAELRETVKHTGVGAGLFGVAGVTALYGGWAVVFTVIYALALVMDVWLAGLVVAVALLVVAAVAAVAGRGRVKRATEPPQAVQRNLKRDVETLRARGN